ncbi:fibronectin type III domain-containing protein [Actinophytocola oryzae]|uniref:Fibronectin type III domain protein n=1 Tax=Actinophytocola oryzae TaxID=502181 RepID=A0A4R7UVT3_9PSEU|nr:fibronectin type III domain-containing protein [Actinophytocola oryzae]TDV40062.1 fibronectin type III domain protein [Actinophytocola oryzae]
MTDKAALVRTWRARVPVVAVVIACVAGVVAAVTGAANPVSAVQFLLPGHWVYNVSLQSVFHVDGSTGDVDARASVPGGPGDQVFQGDTSGYVVGDSRITEFGKSSLAVEGTTTPPAREMPVGVEIAGGPYLVYRESGKIVRLGDEHLVLSLGGPVGTPVATGNGTLWLPRTKAGLLCRLPADADQVSCPVLLPKSHVGALSVVSDRLVFVDTRTDTLQVVEDDGLGEPKDLGVDLTADAQLAGTDVAGRLAILDGDHMLLVDAGLGTAGLERADPVDVDLGEGEYSGPVAAGSVVAVVNRTTGKLLTYDSEGKHKQTKDLPAGQGDPRLTRGEDDRIYVDGAGGEHVVVIDRDGGFADVPIQGEGGKDGTPTPTGGRDPEAPVGTPEHSTEQPDQDPPPREDPPPTTQLPPPTTQKPPPVTEQETPPPSVPPSPPGAPTGVGATAGDGVATVTWGPAPDNRAAITAYRITWAGGGTTVAGTARTATVNGLTNGTSYVFTVSAVNGVGTGPGASANPVTPVAPPRPAGQATQLQVLLNGDGALFDWDAPADMGTGTFTHFIATMTGAPDQTVTGPAAGFDFDPSQPGTLTFTVRVVTTTPDGQQLVGPVATTTKAVSGGSVTVSRGPATEEWCGETDACAWMHVVLNSMRPNTTYHLQPYSDDPGYSNPGGECTTDANGYCDTDQFAYAGVGHTVWIVVTDPGGVDTRSNDLVWEAG